MHIKSEFTHTTHPADIAERLVPGHWEDDHIKGAGNRSQVGTLVERKTLYVALVKLADGTAQATTEGFGTILQRFDVDLRRSSPTTKGAKWLSMPSLLKTRALRFTLLIRTAPGSGDKTKTPMAYCAITSDLVAVFWRPSRMASCFISICQKVQTFPCFLNSSSTTLAWKLNTRPRKSLDWKCPAELFLPEGAFDFKEYWADKLNLVALGL